MRFSGNITGCGGWRFCGLWRSVFAALLVLMVCAPLALAQDAPAEQAPAARKRGAPAVKPTPKPGEVVPMDAPVRLEQASPAPAAKAAARKHGGKGVAPMGALRTPSKGGPITIGALLPLTGSLASQGQSSKAALELAVTDINALLAADGSTDRMSLVVEDTGSTGPKALEAAKTLAAAGIRLVVGPYSDNEVDGVLDFANANGMMLLSQGSAGPYLSKPGDNLFRFSPSDAYQAEALAVLANQEGCSTLITIWAGDMYGDELVTHIKGQFANLGGQVVPGTRFRPDEANLGKYVADLKAQIDKQVKDKKQLGIVVAARGAQTAQILKDAAKLGGLGDVKWYGCDDSALRGNMIQDPEVAKFAAQVRIAFARFGETGTLLYSSLEKRIEEKINAFADTQSLVAYDIAWLATYVAQFASDDATVLRKAIPNLAERFYGTTGWLALNENGDRREGYSFDFWTISHTEGKYYWVKTARYQNDPGSMKQLILNGPEGKEGK